MLAHHLLKLGRSGITEQPIERKRFPLPVMQGLLLCRRTTLARSVRYDTMLDKHAMGRPKREKSGHHVFQGPCTRDRRPNIGLHFVRRQ